MEHVEIPLLLSGQESCRRVTGEALEPGHLIAPVNAPGRALAVAKLLPRNRDFIEIR